MNGRLDQIPIKTKKKLFIEDQFLALPKKQREEAYKVVRGRKKDRMKEISVLELLNAHLELKNAKVV